MRHKWCSCRACKRAKRKGLILGTRIMGFWDYGNSGLEYYKGPVEAYVKYRKFSKGRARKEKVVSYDDC